MPTRPLAIEGAQDDALAARRGRQRALPEGRAASGASGCMKLTDPPLATISMRISLSTSRIVGEARQGRDLDLGHGLAPCEHDEIGAGRGGLVGQGHLGRRAESQAVAGPKQMTLAALEDDELARLHPDGLADMRVGRRGEDHALSARQLDLDDLQGMIGPAEDLLAQIAGLGIAPDRLVGGARQPLPSPSARSSRPARVRSKAPASRTRITAVGLTSSRSILLIVALETPERSASSASDQPRASRSSRRRRAIWVPVVYIVN